MVEIIVRRRLKHRCSTCHNELDIRDFANKYCDDECWQIYSESILLRLDILDSEHCEKKMKSRIEASGYLFIKYKEEMK
jgi:hypothetical protein